MKNVVLALCLLYSTVSFAQYSVTGKITVGDTGEPIAFAGVILHGKDAAETTALSDPSGLFRFERVAPGNYEAEIRYMGYVTRVTEISLGADLDMGTIALSPDAFMVEGVEVVANKQQVIYRLDKRVIDAGSDVIAGGGTAVDIISNLPSVRVSIDGDISFRGSSGFIVQMNGKPSMLTAARALQQIPANRIEGIELITTPSARNQSDGEAGIINIITKQSYGEGLSGSVNVFGDTYGSRGADFTLVKQSGEHRFTLGGIYGQRMRKSDFEQEKVTKVDETTTTSHSKGPRSGERYSYILQAGWQLTKPKTDYYIDLVGGYEGSANKGNLNYSETIDRPGENALRNRYISRDDYDLHETILSGSTGFNHKFAREGHTLKGYFYLKYGGDAMEKFTSDLLDDGGARQHGHEAWEAEHRWTVDARLDYVLPYSATGRMEAGYQYFSYLEDGNYSMFYWNPSTSQFDYRDDIYNTFYFQRGINTIYLLANQRVGKFEFQAGVRAEHTHQVLRSSREWANRTVDRLEFFPSAHVGYHLDETTVFTAAYSRRTNRPELFFMEPYITYRDYYTAEKGNPDIRPEYIDSYELTVKKNVGEQTLTAALFHRSRTDKIERLRVPYHEPGVTLDSMANVGDDYSTGAEIGLNITTGRVWSFTLNGDLYHYSVKNRLDSGGENRSSVNFGASLNNNLRVARNTTVQIDGTYVGPTVRTQGRQFGFFYADFGVRQQFWEGKFVAGLSFRNFLNTAKYRSDIDSGNLNSHTTILPKYPLLTLNLGYVFNNHSQRARGREGSDFFEGTRF